MSDCINQTFYIAQGVIESGIKENILIPADDSTLTQQGAPFDRIMTSPKVQIDPEYEETELPEELVERIIKILDKGHIEISRK